MKAASGAVVRPEKDLLRAACLPAEEELNGLQAGGRAGGKVFLRPDADDRPARVGIFAAARRGPKGICFSMRCGVRCIPIFARHFEIKDASRISWRYCSREKGSPMKSLLIIGSRRGSCTTKVMEASIWLVP